MSKKEKSQVPVSNNSIISIIPKPEFRQGVTATKYNQVLVDKNKAVIEKILEKVKNTTSHAC